MGWFKRNKENMPSPGPGMVPRAWHGHTRLGGMGGGMTMPGRVLSRGAWPGRSGEARHGIHTWGGGLTMPVP